MQTAWLLLELEIREPGVPLGPWASSSHNGDPLEKRPAALPHWCLWAGCAASIPGLHVPRCSESVLIPAPCHLYSADSERKLLSLASLRLVLAVMATPVWWSVFPPRAVVPLRAIQRYRDTLLNISAAHIFCITTNSISIDLWAREITRQWFLLLWVAHRSFPVLQGTASIYSSCMTLTLIYMQHIKPLFGVQACYSFIQISLAIFTGVIVTKTQGITTSAAHFLVTCKPLKIPKLSLNNLNMWTTKKAM